MYRLDGTRNFIFTTRVQSPTGPHPPFVLVTFLTGPLYVSVLHYRMRYYGKFHFESFTKLYTGG